MSNVSVKENTRYSNDGVSFDVHLIDKGKVYFRAWPKNVSSMRAFDGLTVITVKQFANHTNGWSEQSMDEIGVNKERVKP